MQFGTALLTIVLIGTLALFHDPDTTAMLPDSTAIAQNEQSAGVLGLRVWDIGEGLAEGRSWVLLMSANAARNLLFVNCFLIIVHDSIHLFGVALLLVGRLPLTPTRHGRFADVFARKRPWSS